MSGTQGKATGVETIGMTMRFGAFTALDDVSIKVPEGSFHALLGENGAGKSTLVKCMMGFYHPTSGDMLVDGRQVAIASPRDASALGLGMVYQHFTLVPSLTGAENLVISREKVPGVIDWRKERTALAQFMERMPFKLPLDVKVAELAAGEKQKLEIIKQLYLGRNFLVLDEPTSVLTPGEAQEVLGLVRGMTKAGDLTVLMISHKFHEVTAFADDITVLRKGRLTGTGKVSDLTHKAMAAMMIGDQPIAALDSRAAQKQDAEIVLKVKALKAPDRTGLKSIDIADLGVRSGEIVGIAGISGNGQKEFLEVLAGQRPRNGGEVMVRGAAYAATRAEARTFNVRLIPEEPLKNACAPRMTVAENIAFRTFDVDGNGKPVSWISAGAIKSFSARLVEQFKVKTASLSSPIASLSGGNVQRAVLARELTGEVDLLIVSNPCFGLDFSAVAEIRARIMKARNAGAAVLLMSEDLDELLELSDRILVMSDGALVYETPIAQASVQTIGEHMAGHH
ncbi:MULTISPECIES: ABC transporter ATP-binding protein [unclassified Mesorhizobium]|uniref:ABC transporter ATP-binding protein n=3 Tax=Mesorhizobium TaxID=68287 RepID=UPI000F763A0E|nr:MULTISPECIES: ABC transporter ATP-binding protein [unclassified Mesorhizobium]AZO03309.1 ABC transporter ATP-binding protein [Mesorhizobium sp. M2A.F.Ca.ET.043.02.1.1]RUW41465.1 ABC transporter ATP-binding protein [Mesorhizobium sp. M2A.F.Ca.ET.015.02.1.1]RVC96857.1 ABC transporter ATP-binding protein [Mesorhizobium sp. M2A.F.Ca.ET.017.03.2.1]RVD08705.1 ABC transporter ATP-binding protein [Mesorhizobium sp. M2A.F.Ca.ET.029.05.1.1]RWB43839.1 MAG: ABC transporter ATP-binding protein [Mesorhiz